MTQQPSLTELEAQIANQEARIQTLQDQLDELTRPSPRTVSRREALAMLSGGALVGVAVAGAGGQLLVNEATAQAVAEGSIGTEDNPLEEIYVEDWYANQEHLELETLDVTGAGITTTGLVAQNGTFSNSLTVDGALTTEGLAATIDAPTQIDPNFWISFEDSASGLRVGGQRSTFTPVDGDNEAVDIIDAPGGAALFAVAGRSEGGSGDETFVDLILTARQNSTVVASESSGAGSRSYNTSGFNLSVAIDDSGETYGVGASAIQHTS